MVSRLSRCCLRPRALNLEAYDIYEANASRPSGLRTNGPEGHKLEDSGRSMLATPKASKNRRKTLGNLMNMVLEDLYMATSRLCAGRQHLLERLQMVDVSKDLASQEPRPIGSN